MSDDGGMSDNPTDFPHLGERAELLGAIFGDGYIQVRGQKGRKIAVTCSEDYPEWLAQVARLFTIVFDEPPFHSAKKVGKHRRPHHEFYRTTHSLYTVFGVHGKYDSEKRIVPPGWVSEDREWRRRFLRGLAETDGMFKRRRDARYPRSDCANFLFAQKCDYLSQWVQNALADEGYIAKLYKAKAAGVWFVAVDVQDQVRALGEWLESFKWKALVESGYDAERPRLNRKTGEPMQAREAEYWDGIPREHQDHWRELRQLGASIVAIARHYGRSNSVVQKVVADIVPTRTASARDLGLRPKPRMPRHVDEAEVQQWRGAVAAGESAAAVAERFGRKRHAVVEATTDVVWDRDEAAE